VRQDVIRSVEVEFVDLVFGRELLDLDDALTLDRDRLELLGIDLDVCVLANLVPLDDIVGVHVLAGDRVDLALLDAVSGLLVELVEADFLALRRRWEQCDRTRDERELEEPFPVRTRGHVSTPLLLRLATNARFGGGCQSLPGAPGPASSLELRCAPRRF